MKKWIALAVLGGGIAAATSGMVTEAVSQEAPVTSLRGTTTLDDGNTVVDLARQNTGNRFDRSYRQQPPLIPHKVDKYQINTKVNQCMRCHDWPYNVTENAPKISETHYVNRDGIALDTVARTRWFCNQCHVPQVNAEALVPNTFKSATEVK